MRITAVPSAVWLGPTAATAPVRGILTTAPPRPPGPPPATLRPGPHRFKTQVHDAEHHQLESRRAMLRCIARLLAAQVGDDDVFYWFLQK